MSDKSDYEDDVNDAIYTFENARSVNELGKLTLQFLQHKIVSTNYHFGPLYKESKIILPELIQMNKLGFITTMSKPGKKNLNIRQRGYVCGIINKKNYVKFVKRMNEISNKIYIRHTHDNTLIDTLLNIGSYPEWYWILEDITNKKYIHVKNSSNSFDYFTYCDFIDELNHNYFEIEIIDLECGREKYIHKKIVTALEINNMID